MGRFSWSTQQFSTEDSAHYDWFPQNLRRDKAPGDDRVAQGDRRTTTTSQRLRSRWESEEAVAQRTSRVRPRHSRVVVGKFRRPRPRSRSASYVGPGRRPRVPFARPPVSERIAAHSESQPISGWAGGQRAYNIRIDIIRRRYEGLTFDRPRHHGSRDSYPVVLAIFHRYGRRTRRGRPYLRHRGRGRHAQFETSRPTSVRRNGLLLESRGRLRVDDTPLHHALASRPSPLHPRHSVFRSGIHWARGATPTLGWLASHPHVWDGSFVHSSPHRLLRR